MGVAPELMGIGPLYVIPQVLKKVGLQQKDMDWIELNEAFAAQSIAVVNGLSLARHKVNSLGGAIALGHPPPERLEPRHYCMGSNEPTKDMV